MLNIPIKTEDAECQSMSMSLDRDRFSAGEAEASNEAMRIPRRKGDDKFVKQPVRRTVSLPRRTIWKDKGGSARYILRDEPAPVAEVQPVGFGAAAKEAVTDAILSGSVAGLVALESLENVAVATRRHLDRQWTSQKRLSDSDQCNSPETSTTETSDLESVFARGKRGLLTRAKSLNGAASGLVEMRRSLDNSAAASTAT